MSKYLLLVIVIGLVIILSLVFVFAQRQKDASQQIRPRRASSSGAEVINVPAGGNLQKALDSAKCGDTITLQAGAIYSPPPGQRIELPYKGSCTGTDADYITITTSNPGGIPPEGVRLNPTLHASAMPKIVATSDQPAINAQPLAHHYKFVGVEITSNGSSSIGILVWLGVETSRDQREAMRGFVFDRCFVHPAEISGSSLSSSSKYRTSERGIIANVADFYLVNSYIGGFTGYNKRNEMLTSMGVLSDVGPGPIHIINNYIEAWYSSVFLGGADAAADPAHIATVTNAQAIGTATLSHVNGLGVGDLIAFKLATTPDGIGKVTSIKGNNITYEIERAANQTFQSAPLSPGRAQWVGDVLHDVEIRANTLHKRPEWDSFGQPKNWLEVKAGRHIAIDGNLMTSGTPTNIAITVRNQNGSSPWIEINDLHFTNNHLVNFKQPAFGLLLKDNEKVTGLSGNIVIENNLLEGSKDPSSTIFYSEYGYSVVFKHNTILNNSSIGIGAQAVKGFVFVDNIVRNGNYGFNCTTPPGGLITCWPRVEIKRNVIVDSRTDQRSNGSLSDLYPPGNFVVEDDRRIGFVDPSSGNYRLAPTSPLRGRAMNGSDPGVNIDLLNAALNAARK